MKHHVHYGKPTTLHIDSKSLFAVDKGKQRHVHVGERHMRSR